MADTHVGIGDPVSSIVEAGRHHSLIDVSDSGKGWLKRFFVGSVAFNVMWAAGNSVLNIR